MELVLEIGPANGDLAYALEVVHAAADVGAAAVKGQIYDRNKLTTRRALTYAQAGISVPNLQYEDFERQLTYDQWGMVKIECDKIGIEFFASVFDPEAVGFCEVIGVKRYKIASGDITHRPLIELVSSTGKEVILSTGAASGPEVQRAVEWVSRSLTLLACTLSYPCEAEDANLRRMDSLRLFTHRVGYSDHTRGIGAIIRAHELGAVMVEKHFTLTPGMGGDHDFAVTPEELAELDLQHRNGWAVYDGVPALEPVEAEKLALHGARRSICAARDLPQGSIIQPADLAFLRPGGGLEPWQADEIVGLPLRVDVPAGGVLTRGCV